MRNITLAGLGLLALTACTFTTKVDPCTHTDLNWDADGDGEDGEVCDEDEELLDCDDNNPYVSSSKWGVPGTEDCEESCGPEGAIIAYYVENNRNGTGDAVMAADLTNGTTWEVYTGLLPTTDLCTYVHEDGTVEGYTVQYFAGTVTDLNGDVVLENLENPHGCTFGVTGDLYIALDGEDDGTGRGVQVLTADGFSDFLPAEEAASIHDVLVFPDEYPIITDYAAGQLLQWDGEGWQVVAVDIDEYGTPNGIQVVDTATALMTTRNGDDGAIVLLQRNGIWSVTWTHELEGSARGIAMVTPTEAVVGFNGGMVLVNIEELTVDTFQATVGVSVWGVGSTSLPSGLYADGYGTWVGGGVRSACDTE